MIFSKKVRKRKDSQAFAFRVRYGSAALRFSMLQPKKIIDPVSFVNLTRDFAGIWTEFLRW